MADEQPISGQTSNSTHESGSRNQKNDSFGHTLKQRTALRSIEDRIRNNPTESLHIVDADGNEVFGKSDGRGTSVTISPSDFAKAKDNIITHNHPHGYMFSKEDINAFQRLNAREIRATTPDGRTFALRRTGDYHNHKFYTDFVNYVSQTAGQMGAKHWDYTKSYAENTHRCALEHTKVVNKWLSDNAKSYGYKFREEKKR